MRRAPTPVVVLVVVGGLLAACTTEEQSTPPPTLSPATTSSTSTTSTTEPPAATTSPPTAAPTTTSTTTAPTTTLPAAPAASSIPLIVGGESGGWLFLGAWSVDEWRSAFADDGTPIEADLTGSGANPVFTVSALDLPETEARLGRNVVACEVGPDELIGPTVDIDLTPPEPPGFGYRAIAMPAAGRVLKPRPIAVVSGGAAVYQDIGEAAFDGDDVDATRGRVEQTVVADLDGDGDDEALVVFEFVDEAGIVGTPGDFSALLLVDADTRTATTVERSLVPPDDGDDTTFDVIEQFRVLDVLDLNGDGRMEVVVHTWFYEGASVIAYEYDGTTGELDDVLATGCGS